jgi:Arc/MetJ family transcription regulator
MKRTTFMVDEALLEEAKTSLGAKNYSETLDLALREAIRVRKVMNLTSYFGKDLWKGDLAEMRADRLNKPLSRKAQAGK